MRIFKRIIFKYCHILIPFLFALYDKTVNTISPSAKDTNRRIRKSPNYLDNIQKSSVKNANKILKNYFEKDSISQKDRDFLIRAGNLLSVSLKDSPTNYGYGIVLIEYVKKLCSKNKNLTILEFGTARGFSSICMAYGLKEKILRFYYYG